jgi:hypothetical protein
MILGRLGLQNRRMESALANAGGNALAGHQPMHALEFTAQCRRRKIEQISRNFQARRGDDLHRARAQGL